MMIINSFSSQKLPIHENIRSKNVINGSDAETFAASRLCMAVRGEVHWGSREEDNRKIDLHISCEHPWAKINSRPDLSDQPDRSAQAERMLVLAQVKSGDSYGGILSDGSFYLNKDTISKAVKTTHPILLVWVDRTTNQCFWTYIHPYSRISKHIYKEPPVVTPALIFDLARIQAGFQKKTHKYRSITISEKDLSGENLTKQRQKLKKEYAKLKGELESPVLGKIENTKFAWRHVLRKSRSWKNKESSLHLIKYLKSLLISYPSSQSVIDYDSDVDRGFKILYREHLLRFNALKAYSQKDKTTRNVDVIVRVVEEIRYPEKWTEIATLSSYVERVVKLRSFYYKDAR